MIHAFFNLFKPVSHKKGLYIDGHEREDVVRHRKDFLSTLDALYPNHTSRLLSAMTMLQEFVTRLTLVEAGEPGPIVEALPEVGYKVSLGQSDFELRAGRQAVP